MFVHAYTYYAFTVPPFVIEYAFVQFYIPIIIVYSIPKKVACGDLAVWSPTISIKHIVCVLQQLPTKKIWLYVWIYFLPYMYVTF